MPKVKVNKIETEPSEIESISHAETITVEEKPKKGYKKIFKIFIVLTLFVGVAFFMFFSQILVSGQGTIQWLNKFSLVKSFQQLAESADQKLKGEERGRINILLLGMGGKNHDGSYLTDTIILASLDTVNKKVAMVSIPRDLTIPMEDMGWRKINNVNAFAERQNPGSGGLATSQAVSDVLNIPIDYYIRVDFTGFTNIVDRLGGVTVDVENTFDDYRYPVLGMEDAANYNARYEHLHVEQGLQQMNGEFALKYARSRHALGVEGSDFARAKRQQKIIEAVKQKLKDQNLLLNPKLIADMVNEYQENVSTNLKVWEMVKLWSKFKDVSGNDIINKVLDNSANGLLVNKISEEGAYILVPRSGDFTEIQYFVNNIFADNPVDSSSAVEEENPTLEVRNGTWINGLASKIAVDLEKAGFNVLRIGNSAHQNFQKSVIYDMSYGDKKTSLSALKEKTGANVSESLPQWLIDDVSDDVKGEKNPEQPDFILVLGQDADNTNSGAVNPNE